MASPRPRKLISNAHPVLSDALAAATNQVRLTSPYISAGIARQLVALAKKSSARWRVVTSLDAAAVAYGALSIEGLRQMADAGIQLRTNPRLHAKLFLCDPDFGLVGSANLTSSGLGGAGRQNLELGALLPKATYHEAVKQFGDWWVASASVTKTMLDDIEIAAARLPASVPVPPGPGSPLTPDIAVANALLDEARNVELWVKALYRDGITADEPWEQDAFVSSSKRGKPSFAVGDLLVIYAKGIGRCNAVVEVTGATRHDVPYLRRQGVPRQQADRWPWVTPVRGRLQKPAVGGVSLADLGFSGQSLQRGHKRLSRGEFVLAIRYLVDYP